MGQDAATAVLGGKGGFAVPAPPAWIGVENPAAPAGVNSPATAADNPSPGSSEEEGPAASTGEVDWQHIRESWSRAIRKARLLGKVRWKGGNGDTRRDLQSFVNSFQPL